MDLTYRTSTHDGWTVLALVGELDLQTAPQLKEAIAGEEGRVALDLSEVPFMDSSCLGVIVAAHKQTLEAGGEFALTGLQDSPRKVLALTGLDEVVPIFDSVDQLPPA